ncbi:Rha family transcriptional regulator [Enterococcus cecorum]|uniref:Rha family transcriptional regulator n=1 Tax=Enterococcus cecorum TaxID=44008 RepID=A0A7X9NNA4_9ENTE|nr:Rha family transcriptional regulator [Enterococcus cecorum]NME50320.1 Rha family transcriptional regulator [Enterococcus cecorum]
MNLPTNQFNIQVTKDTATIDSLTVAKGFEKRHDNVLKDIETIIKTVTSEKLTNSNFRRLNEKYEDIHISKNKLKQYFIKSEYIDSKGRTYPMYLLTEKGFNLLAMGYNGKKFIAYKMALLDEFERIKKELTNYRQQYEASKPTQKALSQAIAEHPRYKGSARLGMNIATMNSNIIKLVTGDRRMKKAELNAEELAEFETLEHLAIYYLKRGYSISEATKQLAKQ